MVRKALCEENSRKQGTPEGTGAEFESLMQAVILKCANAQEGDDTMEDAHRFRVEAWWASGRTGIAKSSSAPNVIHFTSPPAFGGLEGRWTPEDLLLGAIASCFTTTFRTLAEYSKFDYTDLQVEVEAVVSKRETGDGIADLSIRANLIISREDEQPRALKLLHKAKGLCLVLRTLAIEQTFEPVVKITASAAGRPA